MKLLLACLSVVFFVLPVVSQAELESRLEAYLVTVGDQGEEQVEATDSAEPGQTLEYRLIYRNNSDDPFKKLVINGRIPVNTEYAANSSSSKTPHDLLVSFDGGASYMPEPAKRMVKQADGSEKEETVPPEEYTHLRWKSLESLVPGQEQRYIYRVRVK